MRLGKYINQKYLVEAIQWYFAKYLFQKILENSSENTRGRDSCQKQSRSATLITKEPVTDIFSRLFLKFSGNTKLRFK